MGVRFARNVRREIVAATVLAEARGHSRPQIRDLADAIRNSGDEVPPIHADALNDDLEAVLAEAAHIAGDDEVSLKMLLAALAVAHLNSDHVQPPPRQDSQPQSESASATRFAAVRVGIGYDSHRFAPGGPMVLGAVRIQCDVHCAGHSDGDAVCHALTDAVLGAAGVGDIGGLFPNTDPDNAGRNSAEMLSMAVTIVRAKGFRVLNADVTVIAETPKIGPHRDAMCAALAAALGVSAADVSIKGKTNEGMGWIGAGEGIAVMAVASLVSAPE
jgi:2-C-methyl-D-erythritol 2,4-cyclodiphosphate synthase